MFCKTYKRTITVGHADLTAGTNGLAQAFYIGTTLPAGCRLINRELTGITQFTGGSVSAVTLTVGGTDADAIITGEDVLGGGTVNRAGTAGVNPEGNFGRQRITATFTPDASHKLVDLTAGAITITLIFARKL